MQPWLRCLARRNFIQRQCKKIVRQADNQFYHWADFNTGIGVNFYYISEKLRNRSVQSRVFSLTPSFTHSAGMWCKVGWATNNWYKLPKQSLTVNDNARRIVPSRRLRTLTIFGRCWKNSRYVALSTGICPTYVRTRGMLIQSYCRQRNLVDKSKCEEVETFIFWGDKNREKIVIDIIINC